MLVNPSEGTELSPLQPRMLPLRFWSTLRKGHPTARATIECILFDAVNPSGKVTELGPCNCECILSDACQPSGKVTESRVQPLNARPPCLSTLLERSQVSPATKECKLSDACQPFWKGHRGECSATRNARSLMLVNLPERSQSWPFAINECIRSDACQPVWKVHRGETFAARNAISPILVNPSGKVIGVTPCLDTPLRCWSTLLEGQRSETSTSPNAFSDNGHSLRKGHDASVCNHECIISDADQSF